MAHVEQVGFMLHVELANHAVVLRAQDIGGLSLCVWAKTAMAGLMRTAPASGGCGKEGEKATDQQYLFNTKPSDVPSVDR